MINVLMVFAALLFLAVLVEPLSERLRLPFSALLVLIGFVGSEITVWLGFDTGLRWYTFHNLILHLFLPVLVFESAFNMNARALVRILVPVLFLAIPAMLVAALITAAFIFYGIGYPEAFPYSYALLVGVIVSATDPVAVVALFEKLGAPERLTVLLEGESLFNDVTAVVAFSLLIVFLVAPGGELHITQVLGDFAANFIGGVLVGLITGAVGVWLYRYFGRKGHEGAIYRGILSLLIAFAASYLSESMLHVSGIVAVLCAGLVVGEVQRRQFAADRFSSQLWQMASYIANAMVFLLVGVTVTLAMFKEQWLAMLIGIFAASVARMLVVYGFMPGLNIVPGLPRMPSHYKPVMMWGGLRGAVSLALALSIPTEIEGWYTIQSIVYGVVLFTLFFQAPFVGGLVRKSIAR